MESRDQPWYSTEPWGAPNKGAGTVNWKRFGDARSRGESWISAIILDDYDVGTIVDDCVLNDGIVDDSCLCRSKEEKSANNDVLEGEVKGMLSGLNNAEGWPSKGLFIV